MRTCSLRVSAAVVALLASVAAVAQQAPVKLDIQAQRLDKALNAWADQTGFQVLVPADREARQRTAPAVKGAYTPEGALKILLASTDLKYQFVSERTVTIRSAGDSASDEPAASKPAAAPPDEHSSPLALAQSRPRADEAAATQNAAEQVKPDPATRTKPLEEVVVTGSHIRGINNETVPLLTYDRAAIERSGYSTTQQLVRSLPQNFAGGADGVTEDGIVGPGTGAQGNISSATGVNLRGLGNTSTLVLINGHRVAPSAYGVSVDVGLIPVNAIERVDVLMDGSSAAYGSDAVAGVVNFTLRRDFSGAESGLRAGEAAGGDTSEKVLSQMFGANWGRGGVLLALQYRDRDTLPSVGRSFAAGTPQPTDLLPHTEQYSGMLNVHHAITDRLDVFGDGLFTKSKNERGFASLNSAQHSDAETSRYSANVGTGYRVFADWRLETVISASEEATDLVEVFTPDLTGYTDGTPYLHNDFRISSADIKLDGSLFGLPGGSAKAAIGASYRNEDFTSTVLFRPLSTGRKAFSRNDKSAFAEIYMPFVSSANARPWLRRFDASLAVRTDKYSDFGDSTNPRFGLLWAPHEAISFRASYSTSFRAPTAPETFPNGTNTVVKFRLAAPGGGTVPAFLLTGSEKLVPEESKNWSFGFNFAPASLPDTKVSVGYYHIRFTDRIVTPSLDVSALLKPSVYGSLITPLATDADAAAYLDRELQKGSVFRDLVGGGAADVRYVYSFRRQNAAFVRQNGIDLTFAQNFTWMDQSFGLTLNATRINHIDQALTSTSASTDIVNTYGNPPRTRARAGLSWSRAEWQLSGSINHTGSYRDTSQAPAGTVSSWTTIDLSARYSPSAVRGLSLALIGQNLFDKDPPWVHGLTASSVHYDTANADPLGRFVSLEARMSW